MAKATRKSCWFTDGEEEEPNYSKLPMKYRKRAIPPSVLTHLSTKITRKNYHYGRFCLSNIGNKPSIWFIRSSCRTFFGKNVVVECRCSSIGRNQHPQTLEKRRTIFDRRFRASQNPCIS